MALTVERIRLNLSGRRRCRYLLAQRPLTAPPGRRVSIVFIPPSVPSSAEDPRGPAAGLFSLVKSRPSTNAFGRIGLRACCIRPFESDG